MNFQSSSEIPSSIPWEEWKQKLQTYQQEHVLQFLPELTEEEQQSLYREILSIDWEEFGNITHPTISQTADIEEMTPVEAIDVSTWEEAEREPYRLLGEDRIQKGHFAVCTMAGGQGSRLGHEGPKGTFLVPLSVPKSIFQILAEGLLETYQTYGVYVPWYLMTSEENDAATKTFFEEHHYFGYPQNQVFFFQQGQLPLTDLQGKIVMKSKSQIFRVANGNGGIYQSLAKTGMLADMKARNIEYLAICNVDNILTHSVDPILLGLLVAKHSELGLKSIVKREPSESVGVYCYRQGKIGVAEYSELPKEVAEQTNADGTLTYGETHFGCNVIAVSLLEKIQSQSLPYHIAKKHNTYYDSHGQWCDGEEINSIKYEMFIFDGFSLAENPLVYRVKREEEFAPIKYKEGKDSPESAAKLYEAYHERKKKIV